MIVRVCSITRAARGNVAFCPPDEAGATSPLSGVVQAAREAFAACPRHRDVDEDDAPVWPSGGAVEIGPSSSSGASLLVLACSVRLRGTIPPLRLAS